MTDINPVFVRIVNYARRVMIASKLLLEEDFEMFYELPEIIEVTDFNRCSNLFHISSGVIGLTGITYSFVNSKYQYLSTLLPLSYFAAKILNQKFILWSCKRVIDNFVSSLEKQFYLSKNVLKHLQKQHAAYDTLREKLQSRLKMENSEIEFASKVCQLLFKLCVNLQRCFLLNIASHYESVIKWKIEMPTDFITLNDTIEFIGRINDFYLLLTSSFLSYSFLLLNRTVDNDSDFKTSINFLKDITNTINSITCNIQENFNNVRYTFGTEKLIVKKPCTPSAEHDRTNNVTDNCVHHLQMACKLVLHQRNQNDISSKETIIDEALMHANSGMDYLKVLSKLSANLNRSKFEPNKEVINEMNKIKVDNGQHINADDNVSEASDDEEFVYTPHDSDVECETRERICDGAIESGNSAAVQKLIIKELLAKMKNLKRLKVFKNAQGDLVVQERDITLESATEKISAPKPKPRSLKCLETVSNNDDWFVKPTTQVSAPLPPPLPIPRLPTEETTSSSSKSMLDTITSVAKQINRPEDVFGSDSDGETS